MNIFKLTKEYFEAPKRNVYDLSYTSNLTAKFGYLYPVFIKEVNPGDSMSIQTTFGLRAEPMVFPVQSRMRADIHYFYVRNRTLWSEWMDFYGKLDDTLEHPYINQTATFFKTGSLADYLGVPTSRIEVSRDMLLFPGNGYDAYNNPYYPNRFFTPVTEVNSSNSASFGNTDYNKIVNSLNSRDFEGPYVTLPPLRSDYGESNSYYIDCPFKSVLSYWNSASTVFTRVGWVSPRFSIDDFITTLETMLSSPSEITSNTQVEKTLFRIFNPIGTPTGNSNNSGFLRVFGSSDYSNMYEYKTITGNPTGVSIFFGGGYTSPSSASSTIKFKRTGSSSDDLLSQVNNVIQDLKSYVEEMKLVRGDKYIFCVVGFNAGDNQWSGMHKLSYGDEGYASLGNVVALEYLSSSMSNGVSRNSILPWVDNGSRSKLIKLNALPFRAYEAIYNSFYRNYMNDPFMLNGKPQYNRFVTNLDGGADATPYSLKKRNWEFDFLTSAQQSPQQGEAPLVGISVNNATSTATMKFKSTELETAGVQDGVITAEVKIDDDTNMIGINYYDKDLPHSNLQRLMEAINYGISINDLRQTTSLQRWLEKNIRRGYRYVDQIKSHFGVNLSYKDLLMPEFIGGCSEVIQTNTISQTTPTSDSPLGAYGGQATVIGQSRNNVSHYCDEAGFIIGIMSIVPTPVYSQVPNQFFYKENVLDYYFPEFGKIGMQPIYNKDITPLQTAESDLEKVFGYQRPWWHLISSIDEVHGEFRTSRQGYLVQRMFQDTPILNGDFLTIDNDSINNVFYVDDSISDQFLGQLHFQVTKKTAIPLHGIPSIN